MTEAEKDEHKQKMFEELYPGREHFNYFSNINANMKQSAITCAIV